MIPLLEAQARGEELPGTVVDAYDQACRRLCTENWPQGFAQRQEWPTVDHLLEVARWAAAALQFSRSTALIDREPVTEPGVIVLEDQSPKSLTATVLLARCIQLIGQPGYDGPELDKEQAGRALVALAAHTEMSYTSDARTPLEYLRDCLASEPALRHHLAGHVLRRSTREHVLEVTSITPETGLFPDEDLLYWAERWPHLQQEVRRTAQPLLSHRPRPDDARLSAACERARQDDEELRDATAWWDGPPSPWELRRQAREQQQRHANTFDAEQFTAALQAVHVAAPDQIRSAWHTVLGHLHHTSDGRPAEQPFHRNAVAAAPSCPPQGSPARTTLRQAALPTDPSKPYFHWAMDNQWKRSRAAGEVDVPEGMVLYGNRHFFASNCLSNGIPITDVAEWMGHKSLDITFKIYRHLMPGSIGKAAKVLDMALAA
ncbi:hypothetical protein [Streptomyces sp. NPDC004286]|uniref:hypothetical protein n=1 Tax=Streptomyces sp. NPDC004286 TaxID=3364696 RepID=UPI0036954BAE